MLDQLSDLQRKVRMPKKFSHIVIYYSKITVELYSCAGTNPNGSQQRLKEEGSYTCSMILLLILS